jgi:hypothetical protein
MNADEIVRELREMLPPKVDYAELVCAEGFAHGQCYVWGDPEPYHISAAIDLIESLQAQLAESKRRGQAAVEQIEQQMIFDAQKGCEPCEICSNADKTPCEECNPKWRGPQEAGKGEAE